MHYTQLEQVNEKLKAIITELDEASSRADDLDEAIAHPFGQNKLNDRAHDFESRWDDKRRDLSRDIGKVQQHVQGVVDGMKDWDHDTAAQFEVDVSGQHEPRPV
nr:hypothetical protein [Microbacterium bovistercoris]